MKKIIYPEKKDWMENSPSSGIEYRHAAQYG